MKSRGMLSQLSLLIVLVLIGACQSVSTSTNEPQAPVDFTTENYGETPSPMPATKDPEPTATQQADDNLVDVWQEVPGKDSEESISETLPVELSPIAIKLPPEYFEEVILSPTHINLSEDAMTQFEGTDQHVSALAFDETNALWAQIGSQIVRWNIEDGTYAAADPPPGLIEIKRHRCWTLAEEWQSPTFISDCVLGPDNTYWFSSFEGLFKYAEGEWIQTLPSEDYVSDLAFDHEGNLWIVTSDNVGRFDGQNWVQYRAEDGVPLSGASDMIVDGSGNIWFSVDSGVVRFSEQNWFTYPLIEKGEGSVTFLSGLILDNFGDPWIPVGNELFHYVKSDDTWESMSMDPFDGEYSFSPSVFDVEVMRTGEIWVATEYGALLLADDSIVYFGEKDGLPDSYVNEIVHGPDDTLWLGTSDGIAHFDGEEWVTYRLNEGIDITYALTVSRTDDGALWFGGDPRPVQFDGESWHNYSDFMGDLPLLAFATGPNGEIYGAGCAGIYRLEGETWLPVIDMYSQDPDDPTFIWCITSMGVSPDGSFWVNQVDIGQVNGHGVIHIINDTNTWYGEFQNLFPDRNIVEYPCGREYVNDILVLNDGQVWIGTEDGVCIFDGESWQKISDEVLTSDRTYVAAIQQGADGVLWFGTYDGFAHYNGSVWTKYEVEGFYEDSLGYWRDIDIDEDGNVWSLIGGGIGRFDGDEFVFYSSDSGEDADSYLDIPWSYYASGFAVGHDNSIWVAAGPEGIINIVIPEN